VTAHPLHYNQISIAAACSQPVVASVAIRCVCPGLACPLKPFLHLPLACVLFGAALSCAADEPTEVLRLKSGGQVGAALQRADLALAITPRDAQLRFVRAGLLADLGRPAEAVAALRALSEERPELAEPYNNLAVLHAAAGELDQARMALEQAVRANPSYAAAHENLGDLHAVLAQRAWAQAARLDPSNPSAALKLRQARAMPGGGPAATRP
jgi:tetratricopeptide (TPR) repeat protein